LKAANAKLAKAIAKVKKIVGKKCSSCG